MGREIDLMAKYPKPKRDPMARAAEKTDEDRAIARQFGKEFFDGERRHGYGGYSYQPRFWQPVVPDFQKHFGLDEKSRVLDVGCGKGFMMHDMAALIPGITVKGIDISSYAIENTIADMRPHVKVGDARKLPFENHSFDVVISITTVHNLDRHDCVTALREIERVQRRGSFITVDAYHNAVEKALLEAWVLTGKTVMHVDEWRELFAEAGFTGDYFWFMP